jgi:hypothetical protein
MMNVEQLVELESAGETEVLGENLPFCPPQIPHDLTWTLTRASVVESQQLTT